MSDDLDELERRVIQHPEVIASYEVTMLIERCRCSEERSLYFQRQRDALQLQLDCLNAAMKEGAEAEKELASRWPEAVAKVRCLVKPDSQWAECLDFLVEEVERLKEGKDE